MKIFCLKKVIRGYSYSYFLVKYFEIVEMQNKLNGWLKSRYKSFNLNLNNILFCFRYKN